MMLALSALLLSSPLLHTGGDVLVVDAAGGGDFTSLQAAIDAASPLGGDTILVKAGVYDSIRIDGKGMTIAADVGNIVSVALGTEILNTPSDQPVQLLRLRLQGSHEGVAVTEHGLRVDGCAGSVRVENCILRGSIGFDFTDDVEYGGDGARITASSDVAFAASTLLGNDGGMSFSCGVVNGAGHGITVAGQSLVTLHDSSCVAGDSEHFGCDVVECGGPQGHGANVIDSRLYASGTSFEGGQGGSECLCSLVYPGGAGVRAKGATAHVDLLDVTLIGGPSNPCNGPPGLPLELVDGATSTSLPGIARRLSSSSIVRAGSGLTLTFEAPPGEVALLTVSAAPGWRDRIPWQYGPALGSGPAWAGAVGIVPASGSLTRVFTMPTIPLGEDSDVRYLQAAFLAPGESRLGSPSTVVVLDPQY